MSSSIIFNKRSTLSTDSYLPLADEVADSLFEYFSIPTFHLNSEALIRLSVGVILFQDISFQFMSHF